MIKDDQSQESFEAAIETAVHFSAEKFDESAKETLPLDYSSAKAIETKDI